MPQHYPKLSRLINEEVIPDELGFLKPAIKKVFKGLHYRNLHIEDTSRREGLSCRLEILTSSIGIEGSDSNSGFTVTLNDGNSSGSITAFPVELDFRLPILKYFSKSYIEGLDLTNLSNNTLYEILRVISGITRDDLLKEGIFSLIDKSAPIDEFINLFESNYPETLSKGSSTDTDVIIQNLISQIDTYYEDNDIQDDLFEVLMNLLIQGSTDEKTIQNLETLLRAQMNFFSIEDDIKDLLVPQISASLKDLGVTIEFPRSILKPVNPDSGQDKSAVEFIAGSVFFSTEDGFNIVSTNSLNFEKSYILNTDFTLSITDMQFDLNAQKTIMKAKTDGRPPEFKGVFVETATIALEGDFNDNKQGGNPSIIGKNLVVGNPGGFSGTLILDANDALEFELFGIELSLDTFDIVFHQDTVEKSNVSGTVTIPGLKNGDKDAEFGVSITFKENGFKIKLTNKDNVVATAGDIADIEIFELIIDKENGEWSFSISGRIDRLIDIPKIGDIIPQYLIADPFLLQSDDKTEFDLTLGWGDIEAGISNMKSGLDVDFEYTKDIKIDKTFLDALTLKILHLKFYTPNQSQGLSIDTTLDASLTLGPINGNVGGVGFNTEITFPNGGGNIGPANAEFAFIKPDSIGLSLDIKGFSGGGFIKKMDEEGKVYAGVLDVEFKEKYGLTLMGILALELPEDPNGFSLIGIFDVDVGVELGMGFTLESVGGVIGLHRGMNAEFLRKGVKEDTLDQLMFPENPVENANEIIGRMGKAFPIKQDQFVFGPLALITYGSDAELISAELGLLIEFEDPTRLVILGVIKSTLPKSGEPQLKLQVNFLGEINFSKKQVFFDASLYDSRLLKFTLEGDMVFRLLYGNNQAFIFSVGGFHPSFQPPSHIPLPSKIQRLTITLADNSVISAWAKTYFALTSNTVQFGAHVHAKLDIAVFEITGDLKMDVLIFFRPEFHFIAKISASFDIKAKLEVDLGFLGEVSKSFSVAGIDITVTFKGPSPFHLNGKAKVDFGPVTEKVKINETFGEEESTSLPSTNVLAAIADNLRNSNKPFEAIKPDWVQDMVRLNKEGAPANPDTDFPDMVIDPMGRLRVKQLVAPLNVQLKRFNNGQVDGPDTLTIKYVQFGDNGVKVEGDNLKSVKGEFAPNQFFKKDKAELMDVPAYKEYDAGVETNREADNLDTSCIRVNSGTADETIFTDTVKYRRRNVVFEENIGAQVANTAAVAFEDVQLSGQFAMAGAPAETEVSGVTWNVMDSEGTIVDSGMTTHEEAKDRAARRQTEADEAGTEVEFTVDSGF